MFATRSGLIDVPYSLAIVVFYFFLNNTATTEIYTLSLHDALPISMKRRQIHAVARMDCNLAYEEALKAHPEWFERDRKSTRLNSSHVSISYAVFCLKKKKKISPIFSYLHSSLPWSSQELQLVQILT